LKKIKIKTSNVLIESASLINNYKSQNYLQNMRKMQKIVFNFNISNSPFNCSSISINFVKSLGDSQPTPASLSQLLLSKIFFSKFSYYK
jgi:hypothetical protein